MFDSSKEWFVPVSGPTLAIDNIGFGDGGDGVFATLRQCVIDDLDQYRSRFKTDGAGHVLLSSINSVSFELQIAANRDGSAISENAAIAVLLLLSIKSNSVFHYPFYTDRSLLDISNAPDGSIALRQSGKAFSVFTSGPKEIEFKDLIWTSTNLKAFIHLSTDHEHFLRACQMLHMFGSIHFPQVSIIVIWSGIESLFRVEAEQSFRLALFVSFFLEEEPEQRQKLFDRVKKSYNARSRVAHGSSLAKVDIFAEAMFAVDILRRCVIKCVDQFEIPTENSLLFPKE